MKRLKRIWVWLLRIGHCRGFGIQSPNDYWFVRYVINERCPYYAYSELGLDDDWLTRKLGRLYFRLANWRQPQTVVDPTHSPYWQAGCHKTLTTDLAEKVEILKWSMADEGADEVLRQAIERADEHSVIVAEHIYRNWCLWRELSANGRVSISFDLYYCGILLFEKRPYRQSYIINF